MKPKARSLRGQAIIEFLIVGGLFFMIFAYGIQICHYSIAKTLVNTATHAVARKVAVNADLADDEDTMKKIVAKYTAPVGISIDNVEAVNIYDKPTFNRPFITWIEVKLPLLPLPFVGFLFKDQQITATEKFTTSPDEGGINIGAGTPVTLVPYIINLTYTVVEPNSIAFPVTIQIPYYLSEDDTPHNLILSGNNILINGARNPIDGAIDPINIDIQFVPQTYYSAYNPANTYSGINHRVLLSNQVPKVDPSRENVVISVNTFITFEESQVSLSYDGYVHIVGKTVMTAD